MPSNTVKKRNWAFVVYPESLPDNWIEILRSTGLQCVISPLHDKDINDDGEPKKPHYHVIAVYSGPTSFRVVKSLTDSLNAPIPKALESVRGYYRYLTHKDNPEKAQYDERDIVCINGFSILDFVELTKSEVNAIKKSLTTLIRDQGILEYSDFINILIDNDLTSEFDVASSCTFFFEKYIASCRNKILPPRSR